MDNKNKTRCGQPERSATERAKPGAASIQGDASVALEPVREEAVSESIEALSADCRRQDDRRKAFWRSVMYGNFHPRRRSSRRTFDQDAFLFDWHEPRILYLALAILLLSCMDAFFTLNLLNLGAAEANIIMASALEVGVDHFVPLKITLTSLSVVVLVVTAQRSLNSSYRVEHVLQLILALYLMVICYELYIFGFVFEYNLLRGH